MHFCTSSLHHQVSLSSFLIKHLYCPSHRVILPRTQNLSHLLWLDLVFLSKNGENPSPFNLLHPPLQHHTYSKLITSVPFSSIYPLKSSPITTHPPRDTVYHVIQLSPEFLSLLWYPTCGACTLKSHSTTRLWFPASVWNSISSPQRYSHTLPLQDYPYSITLPSYTMIEELKLYSSFSPGLLHTQYI